MGTVQYRAVIGAVTSGTCPQGEVCDSDQAPPLYPPKIAGCSMGMVMKGDFGGKEEKDTYGYDANGNQATRTINGVTFTLSYDAEGRLVSVNGPSINVTFVYDGDGKRVAQTINGVTMYFVGNYYEMQGSTVTKYYFAGSQRVAMREGGTLYYLLTDRLGSTSITTNASGSVVSEMRYSAWGDVRYASGSSPSEYTFTGQYSDSYINLLDYGSRRYDPEIGRFIQADSIVPLASQGVQAWDRYAYANNAPVRYTDPTGHGVDCGLGESGCGNKPTYRSGRASPKNSPKPFAWTSNNLLSEGTIYAQTWVIPQSQTNGALLASKAEESFTGNLPKADMPYWIDLTGAVTGIASDFYNRFDRYPIRAEINWQVRETGLIIDDLEIKNYSPSFVGVEGILFTTNLDGTAIPVPEIKVGRNGEWPGIIGVGIDFQPSDLLDTTMQIRLSSYPSSPSRPSITILIPVGVIPPPGCSVPWGVR